MLVERKTPMRYKFGTETVLILEKVASATGSNVYRRIGLGSLGRRRNEDDAAPYEWTFDPMNLLTLTLI